MDPTPRPVERPVEADLDRIARGLLLTAPQPILLLTGDGVVCLANRGAASTFRSAPDGLVGLPGEELLPGVQEYFRTPEDAVEVDGPDGALSWLCECVRITARRRDRGVFPAEVSIAWIQACGHPFFAVLFNDVTMHRDRERALETMAWFDPLTRLPNRAHLRDRLDRLCRSAESEARAFALLFIDLDRFEQVNDRLGHGAGDRVLRIVAERLAGALRPGDMIGRYGGDEFLALLDDIDSEEAGRAVAERVVAALREPVLLDGHAFELTVTIGVARYGGGPVDADALIAEADAGMFAAKHTALRIGFADARRAGPLDSGKPL